MAIFGPGSFRGAEPARRWPGAAGPTDLDTVCPGGVAGIR